MVLAHHQGTITDQVSCKCTMLNADQELNPSSLLQSQSLTERSLHPFVLLCAVLVQLLPVLLEVHVAGRLFSHSF
jgi:hypothetical protein